jgi:mevalonate kinase
MSRIYPSKLLLFGEYTVLCGSQALAVPLNHWHGKWINVDMPDAEQLNSIIAYSSWLSANQLISSAVQQQMIDDVEAGWIYTADIPIGYGLGSSGAYVAAIYDRYVRTDSNSSPAKDVLSKMEGYFHGASSGMDPMVSFHQNAVYKDEKGLFHLVTTPAWPEGMKVYLLDSGSGRATGPLVNTFKTAFDQPAFREQIERDLIPAVEHAIHFYLLGQGAMLEACLSVISQFQRNYFEMLIPDTIKHQWDKLTAIPGTYVKFCGAGGGGYFLMITTNDVPDYNAPDLTRIF